MESGRPEWAVRHSKTAVLISRPSPGAKTALLRQAFAFIWAPTCTAARQTLTFRRTYLLPGRPKTLGADLFDTTHHPRPADQAIASAKIYINGKLAFSAPGVFMRFAEVPRPAITKHSVFGLNEIEVVVVKRAANGSRGQCKNNSRPPQPLGVSFYIHGQYEADLWLSNDSGETTEFWNRAAVDEDFRQLFIVGARPQNRGPSGVYSGKLIVDVSGGNCSLKRKQPFPDSARNCVVTQPSSTTGHMECEVFRMPLGGDPRATFRVIAKQDGRFDVFSVFSRAQITSLTSDPDLDTNGWRRIHYFCSKSSTDSRCPASFRANSTDGL